MVACGENSRQNNPPEPPPQEKNYDKYKDEVDVYVLYVASENGERIYDSYPYGVSRVKKYAEKDHWRRFPIIGFEYYKSGKEYTIYAREKDEAIGDIKHRYYVWMETIEILDKETQDIPK